MSSHDFHLELKVALWERANTSSTKPQLWKTKFHHVSIYHWFCTYWQNIASFLLTQQSGTSIRMYRKENDFPLEEILVVGIRGFVEQVIAFPFSCKICSSMFWNALPLAVICGSRTTELISGLWLNLTGLTRHKIFLSQNGRMYMKIYFYFSEDINSKRHVNWKILVNWSETSFENL